MNITEKNLVDSKVCCSMAEARRLKRNMESPKKCKEKILALIKSKNK